MLKQKKIEIRFCTQRSLHVRVSLPKQQTGDKFHLYPGASMPYNEFSIIYLLNNGILNIKILKPLILYVKDFSFDNLHTCQ